MDPILLFLSIVNHVREKSIINFVGKYTNSSNNVINGLL